MALVNPKVPYVTIRDAILTLLRNNVTALNIGLDATNGGTFAAGGTTQIIPGDPRITPIPSGLYPVILVKIDTKQEKYLELGNAGRKRPVIVFNIFGIVQNLVATPDTEIMYLTSNIEGIFRDNIQFDSNVQISGIGNARFGIGLTQETYVDIVQIDLACEVEVK